jgi:hypothetical protein
MPFIGNCRLKSVEAAREGGHRQGHGEDGTAVLLAADQDLAAVFGDDALGDAQSQPGSPAFGLGSEEGIEDGRQDVVGDALAVVDDL